MTGVGDDVQGSAGKAGWRVAGIAAELAIRAVAIECRAGGKRHAPVILFHDAAATDGSDDSHHHTASFLPRCFEIQSPLTVPTSGP